MTFPFWSDLSQMLMDFAQIWVILKLSLRPKGIKCRNISAVTVTAVITAVNLTVAHYNLDHLLVEFISYIYIFFCGIFNNEVSYLRSFQTRLGTNHKMWMALGLS